MSESLFPSPDHDHAACLETAISRARLLCKAKGVKFTNLRERVFKAIAANHKAIGAYDIIEQLAKDGKRIAPISIYRILDAFSEIGLIHRLESRNSYFACHGQLDSDTKPCCNQLFLICKDCDTVVEVDAPELGNEVEKIADGMAFRFHDALLEVTGLCRHCTKN